MGLGRDGESVIHVRHLVTVGYMSRERGWAKDTDLGLISQRVFKVWVWIDHLGIE